MRLGNTGNLVGLELAGQQVRGAGFVVLRWRVLDIEHFDDAIIDDHRITL